MGVDPPLASCRAREPLGHRDPPALEHHRIAEQHEVVVRQLHERVQLEHDLLGVHVFPEMPELLGLADEPGHGVEPFALDPFGHLVDRSRARVLVGQQAGEEAAAGEHVTLQVRKERREQRLHWDRREDQPAYDPFNAVVERHAGPEAVSLVNTYFVHGDRSKLEAMFGSTGLVVDELRTDATLMRFANAEELVAMEIQTTPLGERLSEDVIRAIVEDVREALKGFATDDGALDVPMRGHIVIAHPADRRAAHPS